jgi:surfactin synthase thioesterase subunit
MADLRLICFPHAGAGISVFRPWADLLPQEIELYAVQLPGREEALNETAIADWDTLADAFPAILQSLPHGNLAFYGHSLGATIAFEFARLTINVRPDKLQHLFCAARPWPGNSASRKLQLDNMSDETLLDFMTKTYGSMGDVMALDEIRDIFIPVLRNDLSLLSSYHYQPAAQLPCPLTVYCGEHDPLTAAADFQEWQQETTAGFEIERLLADHLFHMTCRETLVADMATRLGCEPVR